MTKRHGLIFKILAVAMIAAISVATLSFVACDSKSDDDKNVPGVELSEVVKDMSIVVSGYEWGPSVNKVIAEFTGDVTGTLNSSTFSTVKATENRTVNDVYLSDSEGNVTTAASRYVTIDMAVSYSGWSATGSPFTYGSDGLNRWSDSFKVSLTLADGADLKVGGSAVAGGTKISNYDCINNRLVPDTAVFTTDTYTYTGFVATEQSNQTITLNRAYYEPDSAKSDSGKNALVIWLHGAGEGGDDIDVNLLGNEVTALAKSGIQSYFNGGAYVLSVQSPTYWLNSGSNSPLAGEGQHSYYTEALFAAIDDYVKSNSDIDTSRIIVGGCSNGGYMTMNMMFEYGDYFAAYYPICEAYSDSNISDAMIEQIKDYNIWFVQSEDDTTVSPTYYTIPTYYRLIQAGAENVHFTLFEHVTGTDSPSTTYMGHWSWIYVFKDQVKTEFDTAAVKANAQSYVTSSNCTVPADFWTWCAEQGGSGTSDTPAVSGAYRFEAEDAELAPLWDGSNFWDYSSIRVVEVEGASGGADVEYFGAEGNTIEFTIYSDSDVTGATMTIGAASAIAGEFDWSTWTSAILDYVGSEHDILTVNGVSYAMAGTLPGNSEGSYYNWGTLTATIDLVAGENTILFTCDGYSMNVDYIEIATSATLDTKPVAMSATYTFEAEDAELAPLWDGSNFWDYSSIRVVEVEGASGGADVEYFGAEGNTIEFTIYSDSDVTGATMTIGAASAIAGEFDWSTWTSAILDYVGSEHDILTVNGVSYAMAGTLPGNSEGSYYNWGTLTATIDLVAGENTILFTCDGYSMNVDYIAISCGAVLSWAA